MTRIKDKKIQSVDNLSEAKLENLLEGLLNEYETPERPTSMGDFAPVQQKSISLDQAIDKYFIQYEKEAIPTSEVYESLDLHNLEKYLFEQEATPDEEEELDLGAEDEGDEGGEDANDPLGDLDDSGDGESADEGPEDDDQSEPAPVIQTPRIDLQDFTRSVSRLVNNAQSLIDFKSLILNRAEEYIRNNYGEQTAKEMMEMLDHTYDLRPVDTSSHYEEESDSPERYTAVTGPVG